MVAVQRRWGPTGPTGPSGLEKVSTSLTSAGVTPIETVDKSEYSMLSYTIRAKQGSNSIASDFKVLHNGTDVDWVEFAQLNVGTLEIEFTADIIGENIVIYAQCLEATSLSPVEIKLIRSKF